MATFVVLLRGVMPTGTNKVPMAQLREVLEEAGLRNVSTYIQSGNIIVSTRLGQRKLEALVHSLIKEHFGGNIPAIARTPEQMSEIMKRAPFQDVDASKRYFTLLAEEPDAAKAKELKETDWGKDEVLIVGDMIYTLYATKYSDSKFNNNFFERKLGIKATTRNFNTMTKLVELGQASG